MGRQRNGRATRQAISALVFTVAGAWMPGALAQSSPDAIRIEQAAQPLGEALAALGARTGLLIGADAAQLRGLQAPALSGRYTPEAALRALLVGSGYDAVRGEDGSYTLRKTPDSDAMVLPAVRVGGDLEAETATSPARGYLARRSASATKTDTPLIETPQSVTVITADQMQAQRVQSIEQAFEYSAGVRAVSGYSGSYDAFYSRGFWSDAGNGSLFADGLKVSDNSWASGKLEPYGLERLELVKGAASVLYGMSAPGGVLSVVSKRPSFEPLREITAELGSYDRRQLGVDLGGAVTSESDWAWRLTALARDSDTPVGPLQDDNIYLAPALQWQPAAATSLTLLLQHQDRQLGYVFPLPSVGTLLPGPDGAYIARFRFVGEPDFDRQDVTQTTFTALFEQGFGDDATLRHGLRVFDSEAEVFFINAGSVDPSDPRRYLRRAFDEFERVKGVAADTSWQQRWRMGAIAHTTIAGVDYTRYHSESEWYERSIAPLDLYDPVYGAQPGEASPLGFSSRSEQWQTGVYVQDQAKLHDRWVVLAGLRHDTSNHRSRPFFTDGDWSTERANAITGRAGLVYLAPGGWAPFASYSQSFQPQGGTNAQGERFDPTEGEQYELGVRWQPPGYENLMLSASLYDLLRSNVLTPDPDNPQFSVQTGEARARGVEFEARGQLTHTLEIVGAYAYTDRRITRSNRPEEVGRRAAEIPYHQASLWGTQRLTAWGFPSFALGLGVRYIGETVDGRDGPDRIPDYTLADAMLAWEDGGWRVALNARNLTDKEYLVCNGAYCRHGNPRTVQFSVTTKF